MAKKGAAPPLGDLQLAIMRFLWRVGDATLAEIRAGIREEHPAAITTVATVLSRLKSTGMIIKKQVGTRRAYLPRVSQGEVQKAHIGRLVDRLFGGRAADLIAHLVRQSEIDEADLERLRSMLKPRGRRS